MRINKEWLNEEISEGIYEAIIENISVRESRDKYVQWKILFRLIKENKFIEDYLTWSPKAIKRVIHFLKNFRVYDELDKDKDYLPEELIGKTGKIKIMLVEDSYGNLKPKIPFDGYHTYKKIEDDIPF